MVVKRAFLKLLLLLISKGKELSGRWQDWPSKTSPLEPVRAGNISICCGPFPLIIGKFWRVEKHPVVELTNIRNTCAHQGWAGNASRSRGDGFSPPALQSDALLLFYTFCLFSLCRVFFIAFLMSFIVCPIIYGCCIATSATLLTCTGGGRWVRGPRKDFNYTLYYIGFYRMCKPVWAETNNQMQTIWLLNGLPAEKRHLILLYELETTYEEFDLLLVMFRAGYPQGWCH